MVVGDGGLGQRPLLLGAAQLRRVVGRELRAGELAGEHLAEGRVHVDPADALVGVVARHPHLAPRRLEPAVEELRELQAVGVDGAMRLELRNPCSQQALGGLLALRLDHLGGLRVALLLAALGVENRLPVPVERRLGRQVHPQLEAAAHGDAVLLHGVDEAGEAVGVHVPTLSRRVAGICAWPAPRAASPIGDDAPMIAIDLPTWPESRREHHGFLGQG